MAWINFTTKKLRRLQFVRNHNNIGTRNIWMKNKIVNSPFKDVQLPSLTVTDYIWQNIDKWADRPAMVCGITNRYYTYHQLYKYSRKFAIKLRTQLNVRDGDVTCVMMPNNPEYALVTLGSLEAGAAVTTISPFSTAHEVKWQLQQSNPKVIICTPETIGVMHEACEKANIKLPVVVVNNFEDSTPTETASFKQVIDDSNEDYSILNTVKKSIDGIALLPYSSGTTGLPKAVELVNRTIVANFAQQNADGIRHCLETTESHQESLLAVLPINHMYGLSVIVLQKLSVGAKIVTLPKFETKTFLNALKNHKTSILHIVPPLASFLASHQGVKNEYLSYVHTYVCGAAPVPKNDIFRILEKSKPSADFLQIYGLTEISPLVTSMPPGSNKYTSVGIALPNTLLRIVDAYDRNLGPNAVGELLIKGPQIMRGYRNNPEATKAAFTDDGWFRTGDLASIDYDGTVTICGRIKELIKVKGFQVAPAELESVLKEHPDILDAAVVGVPDLKSGEVPKAYIVIKDGRKIKADPIDIKKFVDDRVAIYKRLGNIEFVDKIPRNPSGKILRKLL